MQELMQKYHSLCIRILSRYSNTCVTKRIYELTEYLFQSYKLTYAIIDPFILQAWVFLHTVLKSANLKSRQQRCLSKPSNIMSTNISAYTVHRVFMCLCTYVWCVCVCWCCTDSHILEMSQHPIISTSRQLIF